MFKNERVVVTGGAGFIGSHLAEELVKRGYRVTILDDLSTGKLENIEGLISPSCHPEPLNVIASEAKQSPNSSPATHTSANLRRGEVDFVQASITRLPLLKDLFKDARYVFHQAAIPSVPRSIEDPQASHEVNATGTLNVLIAARDAGVRKVICASSCAIYGDTQTLPIGENVPPNPQSPYAATKLAGEYYCHVFHEVYGLPTVCLRYFNVYGPRQDPESQYAAVIPLFISRALDNRSFVIYGDGEQTRDFTYVKDVVDVNILAAESDAAGVYNVGRGERVTVNKLAGIVIGLAGNSVEPVYEQPRPGDILHSLADISRAREFGYEPKYDLEEGLKETLKAMSKSSVTREE